MSPSSKDPTVYLLIRGLVLALIVVSTPVYMALTATIWKYRKTTFVGSFFTIFVTLSVLDHIKLFFYYIFYGLPFWNLFPNIFLAYPEVAIVGTVGINMVEPAINIGTILMSSNRALAVVWPMRYTTMWTPTVSAVTTAVQCVFGPLTATYLLVVRTIYVRLPAAVLGYECVLITTHPTDVDRVGLFGRNATLGVTVGEFHFAIRSTFRVVSLVWHTVCYLIVFVSIYLHYRSLRRRTSQVATVSQTPADAANRGGDGNEATTQQKTANIIASVEIRLAIAASLIALSDMATALHSMYAAYNTYFIYADLFRHYIIIELLVFTTIFVSPWTLLATSGNVREHLVLYFKGLFT